jgi:outer membrane protein OmpA-like peptidoglycan-associated protein
VDYSASGSTFLYLGAFGGVQPQLLGGGRISGYVIRGTVRDVEGNPVEGAALEIGDQMVFTDSRGGFFLRDSHPGTLPLRVLTPEFLLPGQWEVVQSPAEAVARAERHAGPIEVILRRAGPPPPAPVPAAPPVVALPATDSAPAPAPTPAAAPAGAAEAVRARYASPQPVASFRWGSRRLPPVAASRLDSLARELSEAPEVTIEIRGHADSTGSQRFNRRLSRRRADAVRRDLLARGVQSERLTVRALGAEAPVADNATSAGRARNRRVEVRALSADSRYRTSSNSTSNTSVAPGGITGGAPCAP